LPNVIAETENGMPHFAYEVQEPPLESTFVLLDNHGRGCRRFTPGRWTPLAATWRTGL